VLVPAPGASYQTRTGTSFAAPQVSGVAALLLERNRKLDPVAIRGILTATARDLGPPGQDDQFGAGIVDALSALEQAREQSTDVSARGAQTR
jgi:subtilisin family serine protease